MFRLFSDELSGLSVHSDDTGGMPYVSFSQ